MYAPLTFICRLGIMTECSYITVNKLEAIYFLVRAEGVNFPVIGWLEKA